MHNMIFTSKKIRYPLVLVFLVVSLSFFINFSLLMTETNAQNVPPIYLLIAYEGKVKTSNDSKTSNEDSVLIELLEFTPPNSFSVKGSVHTHKSGSQLKTYHTDWDKRKKDLQEQFNELIERPKDNQIIDKLKSDGIDNLTTWQDHEWFLFYDLIKKNNFKYDILTRNIIGYIYLNESSFSLNIIKKYFPESYTNSLRDEAIRYIFISENYRNFLDQLIKEQAKTNTPNPAPQIPPRQDTETAGPDEASQVTKETIPLRLHDMDDNIAVLKSKSNNLESSIIETNDKVKQVEKSFSDALSTFYGSLNEINTHITKIEKEIIPEVIKKLDEQRKAITLNPEDTIVISDSIINKIQDSLSKTQSARDRGSGVPLYSFLVLILVISLLIMSNIFLFIHLGNKAKSTQQVIQGHLDQKLDPILKAIPHEQPNIIYDINKILDNKLRRLLPLLALPSDHVDSIIEERKRPIYSNNIHSQFQDILHDAISPMRPLINNINNAVNAIQNDDVKTIRKEISQLLFQIKKSNDSKPLSPEIIESYLSRFHAKHPHITKEEIGASLSQYFKDIQLNIDRLTELFTNISSKLDKALSPSLPATDPEPQSPIPLTPTHQSFTNTDQPALNPSPGEQILSKLHQEIPSITSLQSNLLKRKYDQIHPKIANIDLAIQKIMELLQIDHLDILNDVDAAKRRSSIDHPAIDKFLPVSKAWLEIKNTLHIQPTVLDDFLNELRQSPKKMVDYIDRRPGSDVHQKVSSFINQSLLPQVRDDINSLYPNTQGDATLTLVNIVRQIFIYFKGNMSDIQTYFATHSPSLSDEDIEAIIQEIYDLCGIKEIPVITRSSKFDPFFHEDSRQPINLEKDNIPDGRVGDIITPGYWIDWASIVLQKTLVKLSC